jgi:hypothetical protein
MLHFNLGFGRPLNLTRLVLHHEHGNEDASECFGG